SNTVKMGEPESFLKREEFENAEELIKESFEEVTARSLIDLIPGKNHGFTFKIDFIDLNQKPIRCKCRPLPWNLKDKVRQEIESQVQAVKRMVRKAPKMIKVFMM
ncbi:hypothetical protein BpHYR1_021718, partial [Brachionus plicatilis]